MIVFIGTLSSALYMPPQNPPSPAPPSRFPEAPANRTRSDEFKRDVHRKVVIFGIAAALIAVVTLTYFSINGRLTRGEPQVAEEVYALVRDKVSKSAVVPVNLPKGVTLTPDEAEIRISFDPPY